MAKTNAVYCCFIRFQLFVFLQHINLTPANVARVQFLNLASYVG